MYRCQRFIFKIKYKICFVDNKKSEQLTVNEEVKETINELQECIEIQRNTFTELQNEYLNYQVVNKSYLKLYNNLHNKKYLIIF